jgi:hypothetical protein
MVMAKQNYIGVVISKNIGKIIIYTN